MVQSLNKKKTNRQLMVTKILHSSTNINKTNNYLWPLTREHNENHDICQWQIPVVQWQTKKVETKNKTSFKVTTTGTAGLLLHINGNWSHPQCRNVNRLTTQHLCSCSTRAYNFISFCSCHFCVYELVVSQGLVRVSITTVCYIVLFSFNLVLIIKVLFKAK